MIIYTGISLQLRCSEAIHIIQLGNINRNREIGFGLMDLVKLQLRDDLKTGTIQWTWNCAVQSKRLPIQQVAVKTEL